MKTKAHSFDRMSRHVLRDRGAIPLKAEVSEKRHGRIVESKSFCGGLNGVGQMSAEYTMYLRGTR
jgi:hypothetical protein